MLQQQESNTMKDYRMSVHNEHTSSCTTTMIITIIFIYIRIVYIVL